MFLSKKIRLLPTPEQEILFWKSAGTARWAYNYFLGENERLYNEYLTNGKQGQKYISGNELRKYINNVLKKTTHTWLSEVGSNVMKQAVKDSEKALKDFLAGEKGRPQYKSKRKDSPSFYVNYESLRRTDHGFQGEKIGKVKTRESLPKLKDGQHYADPHITYDGKYWYLSVGYDVEPYQVELTGESLGIDLGIKDLAICSNGKTYKNINKTKRVKQLKKRLKREQRKLSRKMESNIKGYTSNRKPMFERPLDECKNFQKQKAKVKSLYKKLHDIRTNHLHQTTTEIVKTKPSRIVLEDLNVRGMMKNHHLSKAISEQGFYEFKRQMVYKCELYGIELVFADRYYPSSKTCSECGNIKKDLKLSDRIYRCDCCGLTIDRDFNASLNLARYNFA